jgi:septum formation protein
LKQIILASQSPRRKQLLQQMGLTCKCMSARIDEDHSLNLSPPELSKELARQKAQAVLARVSDGIVIAADTIVFREGIVMGKPGNKDEAYQYLSSLSGMCHQVITGLCVVDVKSDIWQCEAERTRVFFRTLTDREIKAYIDSGEPMDKAGAYGIQGRGAMLVEKIEGCYFNVVGLPVTRLYLMLKKIGIDCLGGNQPDGL